MIKLITLGVLLSQIQAQKNSTDEEQFVQESRNIFYSCIVTTQNYIGTTQGVDTILEAILEPYNDLEGKEKSKAHSQIWKRVFLDGIKICVNRQTPQGAAMMYSELQQQNFNQAKYFALLEGYSFEKYFNRSVNLNFTKEDDTIWTMVREFQNKIEANQQEFDEMDMMNEMLQQQYDTNVFGVSLSQEQTQRAQIIVFVAVFGFFFLFSIIGILEIILQLIKNYQHKKRYLLRKNHLSQNLNLKVLRKKCGRQVCSKCFDNQCEVCNTIMVSYQEQQEAHNLRLREIQIELNELIYKKAELDNEISEHQKTEMTNSQKYLQPYELEDQLKSKVDQYIKLQDNNNLLETRQNKANEDLNNINGQIFLKDKQLKEQEIRIENLMRQTSDYQATLGLKQQQLQQLIQKQRQSKKLSIDHYRNSMTRQKSEIQKKQVDDDQTSFCSNKECNLF
ncbi:hypothetical protein pb186bvf_010431 [Paramecium bursaria]